MEEAAQARPGVLELMDEAINTPGVAIGICSASTRAGFEKVRSTSTNKVHPRTSFIDLRSSVRVRAPSCHGEQSVEESA